MKKDISNFDDIKFLVDSFYTKAMADDTIGYIFNDVLTINWEEHFPIMYSFWQAVLLGTGGYRGNVVRKHVELNGKENLTDKHFDRWIELWEKNIDENFTGEKAEEAKEKAKSIRGIMQVKIKMSQDRNFIQ